MIQAEVVRIDKSEQASLLSAVTQMLADLMQTPGMEQQFQHLYNAQQKLAQLFGYDAASVDVVLSNTLAYREAFRNDLGSKEHIRQRVSQPPDFPSSPEDFTNCDCGDVDCCDGEEEVDEHEDILDRLSGLERDHVRTVERCNRLENRIIDADGRTFAQHERTDTIQKEVQHWHLRITDLHNELVALQKSVRELLTWTTTLRCEPQPDLDGIDD